jgi:hypothetical protein
MSDVHFFTFNTLSYVSFDFSIEVKLQFKQYELLEIRFVPTK